MLYSGSYALILGISNYTEGWPTLPGVPEDIENVAAVLRDHGFEVTQPPLDLTGAQLAEEIEDFLVGPGAIPNARVLIYFAGHGTRLRPEYGGPEVGYFLPADAPRPTSLEGRARLRKLAFSVLQVDLLARQLQASHALFIFDYCFSGSIFEIMRSGEVPPYISESTGQPVRQFITSSQAGEEAPDRSRFAEALVAALRGAVDDDDGYLTGRELGLYLAKVVSQATRGAQNPQYGRLADKTLGQGDFVFELPGTGEALPPILPTVNMETLKRRAEMETVQAKWQTWQLMMNQYFREFSDFCRSDYAARFKVDAWRRFMEMYGADNPFSKQDDDLREQAWALQQYWHERMAEAQAAASQPVDIGWMLPHELLQEEEKPQAEETDGSIGKAAPHEPQGDVQL